MVLNISGIFRGPLEVVPGKISGVLEDFKNSQGSLGDFRGRLEGF